MQRDHTALHAFIDAHHAMPHAWGREANDCVGFALGAVEAQTGIRVAPDVDWTTRAGALRVIKKFGSIEAAFDCYFERVAPAQAHRGDIGCVPVEILVGVPADEAALISLHPMIVEGATLVTPGPRGLQRAPRHVMACAWSITSLKQ